MFLRNVSQDPQPLFVSGSQIIVPQGAVVEVAQELGMRLLADQPRTWTWEEHSLPPKLR